MKRKQRQLFSDFNVDEDRCLNKHSTAAVANIALVLLDSYPRFRKDAVQVAVNNAILAVCRELTKV